MGRALWLADVLRSAGVPVVEVSGWRERGSDNFSPRGMIAHATAGSASATDASELNVILNGSSSAPPPISQLMLGRGGVWYVVASGRCNHALTGWGGPFNGLGNTNLLGIEGCNNNLNESWNSYGSYVRGVAAIRRYTSWMVAGHKEHQPGAKTDPTFNMNTFRLDVENALDPDPSPSPVSSGSEIDMLYFAPNPDGDGPRWGLVSGGMWFEYDEQVEGTGLALGASKNFVTLDNAVYLKLRTPFANDGRVLSG